MCVLGTKGMPFEFSCFQSGCEFMVRADSEDEIVHLVQEHAQWRHEIELDQEAIAEQIERT